jgi:hypothetical protein
VAFKLVFDYQDPAVRRYFGFMDGSSCVDERVKLQRSVGHQVGISLTDQKFTLTQWPQISGSVTHAPLGGLEHFPVWEGQRYGPDDLVGIGAAGFSLPPHQTRLVESEKQVLPIDEIEGTKGLSRQHVEGSWRPIS